MAVKESSPRIATFDLETSPLVFYGWRLGDQTVGLDQLIEDWTILSFCWKWFDDDKLIYVDTGGRGKAKVRDDKALVKQLWKLLDEADCVIAQNGAEFDVKKASARMAIYGMKPYSPIRVIDTLKVSKSRFSFTSNKLAYTSQKLTDAPKDEHKEFPGLELWKACLADNPAAWRQMKFYNCRDVIATEKKYLALRPWILHHPNVGSYAETVGAVCQKCGSGELHRKGEEVTQHGKYWRLRCKKCGGWGRTKQNLIPLENRRRMLAG